MVTTHANGDHCWGNQLVDYATIVGSAATASGMGDEIRPDALVEMIAAAPPGSALGDYLRQFFGHFDFAGIHLTPPSETFIGETTVWAGHRRIDLLEVGPAHTAGDVIAYVPDQRVLYAGDILFVGDHPVMWTGPVDGWVRACERILELDPVLVVPGHGPITDQAGVLLVRDYLLRVGEHADHCFAAGTPYWEAADGLQLPDEYASWGHPERLVMTIAAIYRRLGFDGPTDLPTVLTHTAAAYRRLTIGA